MFKHPSDVCMTYLQHCKFSLSLSFQFAYASFAAFIHAIYPDVYVTHSTDTIDSIKKQMKNVGCR